jgi:hypothetical protein
MVKGKSDSERKIVNGKNCTMESENERQKMGLSVVNGKVKKNKRMIARIRAKMLRAAAEYRRMARDC